MVPIVRRVARAVALTPLVLATACGGSSAPSPTSPSGAVTATNYSGLWSGAYAYTACEGERHCVLRIGTRVPFTLRLQQSGAHVKGLFTQWEYVVGVEGDVTKDGSLVLTGAAAGASQKDPAGEFRITSLTLQHPESGLAGSSLQYEIRPGYYAADYYTLMRVAGTLDAASRTDLGQLGSFDGRWTGRFVVRSCAPVAGGRYCYPFEQDELGTLDLTLVQSGSTATGTLKGGGGTIPVNGNISGTTITLEGEVVMPASGGGSRVRILRWSATRDGYGALSGAFDFLYEYPADAQPRLGATAQTELWQVVRTVQ